MKKFVYIALCIGLVGVASMNASAQAPGVTPKALLKTTLSDDPTKEGIMMSIEFPPGSTTGRHTHPGDEYAFVLQGTLELSVEGRETRRLSPSDVWHTPRDIVHENRNVGDTSARVVITFIVDKGKPVSTRNVK